MKKQYVIFILLLLFIAFTGCKQKESKSSTKKEEKKKIVIGVTEITEISVNKIIPILESKGYTIELKLFDNNMTLIKSLNDNSIDMSFGQHNQFIKKFNEEQKGDLVMIEPYTYYTGIGLYSNKYKSLDEIPDKAKIAIMNDAMNMDKGLRMLQDAKLITLNPNTKSAYSLIDIIENPKNLEIIDMEQSQTVRSLDDLDASIIFFTHMFNAKKDVSSYLFRDQDAKNYPIGVIVKEKNKDALWAKETATAFKDKNVQKAIDEHFPGVFIHF